MAWGRGNAPSCHPLATGVTLIDLAKYSMTLTALLLTVQIRQAQDCRTDNKGGKLWYGFLKL